MMEFVSCNLKKIDFEAGYEETDLTEEFLFFMPEVKQADILEQFYYWEKQGSISLNYTAMTTDMVKYMLMSTERYLKGDEVQTVNYYDKYKKKCYGIDILNESWIWMD